MALPAEITYGHVVGTFLLAVADGPDEGRMPDSKAPADLRVLFTPKGQMMTTTDPVATIVRQTIECTIGEDGRIRDPQEADGVWLVAGQYAVSYTARSFTIAAHDIEVLPEHTAENPLDLTTAAPAGTPPTTSQWVELNTRIDQILAIKTGPPGPKGDPGDPLADTGWRSLPLLNGWTSNSGTAALSPAVRRVGSTVWVRVRNLNGGSATSPTFSHVPTGFRPPSADGGLLMIGSAVLTGRVNTAGDVQAIGGNGVAGVGEPTTFSYFTEQAWPTTLPGTSA